MYKDLESNMLNLRGILVELWVMICALGPRIIYGKHYNKKCEEKLKVPEIKQWIVT